MGTLQLTMQINLSQNQIDNLILLNKGLIGNREMVMQPYVLEAVEHIRLHAQELLSGQDALTDKNQRTLMLSIFRCTKILLDGYPGYFKAMAEVVALEIPEALADFESRFPLSQNQISSISTSIEVVRRLSLKSPLTDPQIQHVEAIEASQKIVVAALHRWMDDDLKRQSGRW